MPQKFFSKDELIKLTFDNQQELVRGVFRVRQEFGRVKFDSEARLLYVPVDPLNGELFWLSHLTAIYDKQCVTTTRISHPINEDFIVDKIDYWIKHSEFELGLIYQCFLAFTNELVARKFLASELTFEESPDFGFCYLDFNNEGQFYIRANYRRWIMDSLENGHPMDCL